MTLHLYRGVSLHPPQRRAGGHAGLWFDKFCNTLSTSSQGDRNPKFDWISTLAEKPIGEAAQIEESAFRVVRLVKGCKGIWAVFTAESRFVTGLGRSHPVENGFAWHPTLGTPYLSGSSIKGMMRAWAKQEVSQRPGEKDWEQVFGKQDTVGSVCILDALPIAPVQLEADVMTPHYAGWNPKGPPGDWLSPTPIPFLVTAAETSFLFGIVPRSADGGADLELVESWLRDALEWAGAGAKTAVGYGRFAHCDAKTKELEERLNERTREREERVRQEMEAREREAQLASLSPVEREIQEALDNRQDPNMPETTAIYQTIESGRWSGNDRVQAARWLKVKMEEEGRWKATTQARRPERDWDHQRTLQIMRWLAGD